MKDGFKISYDTQSHMADVQIGMVSIETERLLITTWTDRDLEDACALWGDPKVMQFIDVRGGLNRDQVWEKLHQEIERQQKFGVQYWKLLLKETKKTTGCCGLRPYNLKNRIYEIGFHIMSAYWGKGYASEAANAVIRYAFDKMRAPKLFAGHNPRNSTSKAMMEKLGFKFVGEQFYEPTGLNHPSYELEAPSKCD